MSSLTNEALKQLTRHGVDTFFVSGAATKWWNARREGGSATIRLFGGWYWTMKKREEGPFRCESAALRDAYYRGVLNREPPGISKADLKVANKNNKPKAKRIKLRVVA